MRSLSKIIKSFRIVESQSVEEIKDHKAQVSSFSQEELEAIKSSIIEEAEREASVFLKIAEEKAKIVEDEALKMKNSIIEEAKSQYDSLVEEAKKEGYDLGYTEGLEKGFEEAFQKGKKDADKLITEALEIKDSYIKKRDSLLKDLEEDIIGLVLEVNRKVFGEAMSNKDLIIDLVLEGIKNLDPTDNLVILVSKEDYEVVEDNKDLILSKASLINNLEIKYDVNLNKGDCILETEKGNLDISLQDQVEKIEMFIKNILDNE